MTGVLAWNNRCWSGTASELNSAAESGSAPANALTKHLFDTYRFDGTTNQAVLRVELGATFTERMAVAICGLETSSGAASAATFTIDLYDTSTLRESVSVSAIDVHKGTAVALASQAYAINRVELSIAANDGDTWLGIGAIWAGGPRMIVDRNGDAILEKALQVVPMNRDYVTSTPGNQRYTRSTARYRRFDMSLFSMAQDTNLRREELDAIGSAWEYAGHSEPVIAAATTNRSDLSVYGHFVGNPPIMNQPTDLWMNQLAIEERG